MGFVKKKRIDDTELPTAPALEQQDLITQCHDSDVSKRRFAVQALAANPVNADILLACLTTETDPSVQEAIFNALITINTSAVVVGLVPYLRCEDVALRNAAIEALQLMPEVVAPHLEYLLCDADSDVRIMALDVLQIMRHPDAEIWLRRVIEQDSHVNVCATAVDRLSEIGTVESIPALHSLAHRFRAEPFIRFAIKTAIERIEGSSSLGGVNVIN